MTKKMEKLESRLQDLTKKKKKKKAKANSVEDNTSSESSSSDDEATADFAKAYAIDCTSQANNNRWFLDSGATHHVTGN